MTDTTNLGLTLVPANTLEPSVPINSDLIQLDAAVAGTLSIEFTVDANLTLTEAQYQQSSLLFTDSVGPTLTTGRDVIYPAHFPVMYVKNSTLQTLTLKKSGQTGVALTTGSAAMVASGVTDVVAVTSTSGGGVAGADKQVQYNNAGAFGAEAGFEYDQSANTLSVPKINESKGADIASAGTTDIGAATGNYVHVTGTTTITAFGTVAAGARRLVVFDGALTLTHNATSLILPTGANITTAAGDALIAVSEGSGNWRVTHYQRKDGTALASSGGGSLTGFTSSLETASPNNTVNVSKMLASGGTTDQDIALQPKGNGGIAGQTADSTATGGNKRGTKAVDLQLQRSAASQVASGTESFIAGSRNSTASAANTASVGGQTNVSSAQSAGVFAGESQTASGARAVCVGGTGGAASGADSFTIGGGTASAANSGAFGPDSNTRSVVGAISVGMVSGTHPRAEYTLTGSTTSATPVVLTTNAAAAAATNQPYFGNANNRSAIARIMVVARKTGNSGGKKSWQGFAHLDRDNDTVSLVGSATMTVVGDSGVSWSVAVTADNTLKVLKVEATGEAATTIRWACHVEWQEVAGS